jgi:hypothetical protein
MAYDDHNLDHRMGWIAAMLEAEWALRNEDHRDLDAWIRQHRPHVLMPPPLRPARSQPQAVESLAPTLFRPHREQQQSAPVLRLIQGGRA